MYWASVGAGPQGLQGKWWAEQAEPSKGNRGCLFPAHLTPRALTSLPPAAIGAHFILGCQGQAPEHSEPCLASRHWTWGISLTCWLPWTTSPSLKVLDPGPTPFSLRPLPRLPLHTPAGAPPPPLATSPSELLVIGLGLTPSPCQPIRVVFMFPPFTQRMHMKSLKSELGIFSWGRWEPESQQRKDQIFRNWSCPWLLCSGLAPEFPCQDPSEEASPNSEPQPIPSSHFHSFFGIGGIMYFL